MPIKLNDQNLVYSSHVDLWSLSEEINVKKVCDYCFKTHDTTLSGKDRWRENERKRKKKKENSQT